MKKFILIAGICFMSGMVQAQITDTPCANGAGVIVKGSVSGKTYCKSNAWGMTWWNAYAWCDALGMDMFGLEDCACSDTVADCAGTSAGGNAVGKKCPEVAGWREADSWVWAKTAKETPGDNYLVHINSDNDITAHARNNWGRYPVFALCY